MSQSESTTPQKIEVKAKAHKPSDVFAPVTLDAIMLIIGVCMLIWPDGILKTISIVLGTIMLAYALFNIIKYARIEEKRANDAPLLISGITVAIIGIFLIVQSGFIEAFFSIAIGIILTISGILHLQDAMKQKTENKTPMILSIIALCCGILCMLGKLMPIQIMVMFVGVLLILFALSDMTGSVMIYKKK